MSGLIDFQADMVMHRSNVAYSIYPQKMRALCLFRSKDLNCSSKLFKHPCRCLKIELTLSALGTAETKKEGEAHWYDSIEHNWLDSPVPECIETCKDLLFSLIHQTISLSPLHKLPVEAFLAPSSSFLFSVPCSQLFVSSTPGAPFCVTSLALPATMLRSASPSRWRIVSKLAFLLILLLLLPFLAVASSSWTPTSCHT